MTSRSLGQLERSVMDLLWAENQPLTAYDIRDRLDTSEGSVSASDSANDADKRPAATTILTVLSRLTKKGFVTKDQSHRPHLFSATSTQEDHTAGLLHEILEDAADKEAVLARFIGGIDADEAETLRRILNARA